MLATPQSNQENQRSSLAVAGTLTLIVVGFAMTTSPLALLALPLCGLAYWWLRHKTKRRIAVLSQPFPPSHEATLIENVAFYRALDKDGQTRFRSLIQVFLDEVPITGIRTEVDDATRVLVAASAAIPVFGFHDWEYAGLGEVLIYPGAFDEGYSNGDADSDDQQNILGMVGTGHLSGVMILSKPDLWAGFANPEDKRNVGVHEFAHLVDKADGVIDGLPPGVTADTAKPWIRWVGEELRRRKPAGNETPSHIDDYAYTNEAEYFAVLSEYFFEAPDVLQRKDPEVYEMMQSMYHQNTRSLLSHVTTRKRRVGRNAPCPCGSGKKYKHCCRRKHR